MAEHRTKTFLVDAIKDWAKQLAPEDLNLSNGFEVHYAGTDNSSAVVIRIYDPVEGFSRVYQVTVKECT